MEGQKMIFKFYPWTLDIDVETTKQLYLENGYSTDLSANTKFAGLLSEKQKDFINFSKTGERPDKQK